MKEFEEDDGDSVDRKHYQEMLGCLLFFILERDLI